MSSPDSAPKFDQDRGIGRPDNTLPPELKVLADVAIENAGGTLAGYRAEQPEAIEQGNPAIMTGPDGEIPVEVLAKTPSGEHVIAHQQTYEHPGLWPAPHKPSLSSVRVEAPKN